MVIFLKKLMQGITTQTPILFENLDTLTSEQKNWLDECTRGQWTLNPQTGLVDVEGDFVCSRQNLQDFKGIRFGEIGGSFYCGDNSLTSLEGAPQEVGRSFYCEHNSLTSLKGAPQRVGGNFYCGDNSLTSLEGAPQEIGGSFSCRGNSLTNLEGAPQEVGGSFNCWHNSLTSLEGAPQRVGGSFDCEHNSLTSLKGAPQRVGGSFDCDRNPVSEQTLLKIFQEMQEGHFYSQALERLALEVPKEDWEKLDKSGVELDAKFAKGASVLRRFL